MSTRSAEKSREYRARQLERVRREVIPDPGNPAHGKKFTYDCGCRCELCRAAKRAANRKADETRRKREMGRERWGEPWTDEDDRVLREMWGAAPCAEVARVLQRTTTAVRTRARSLGLKKSEEKGNC